MPYEKRMEINFKKIPLEQLQMIKLLMKIFQQLENNIYLFIFFALIMRF